MLGIWEKLIGKGFLAGQLQVKDWNGWIPALLPREHHYGKRLSTNITTGIRIGVTEFFFKCLRVAWACFGFKT
jgi:hypothetical protein